MGSRERLGIALVFGAALTLRVLHVLALQRHDPFFDAPAVDALMYHQWAQRIAEGDWLGDQVFLNGPLYPYALGALYALAGPSLWVAKLAQAVLGAVDCVLVWWLGRRLFDPRVGLLAAAMLALYRMHLFFEGTLVVANLQTTLTLLGVIAAVAAAERDRWLPWLGVGALVGLSALARPTALLFGGGLGLGLLLGVCSRGPWKRRAGLALALALGVAAAISPATIRNAVVGGDFVLVTSAGGMNLYAGNNPSATGTFRVPRIFPQYLADDPWEQRAVYQRGAEQVEGRSLRPSEVSRFWRNAALRWIRHDPAGWGRLMLRKLRLAVNAFEPWNIRTVTLSREFSWVLALPLLGFGWLAPLAFAGLCWSARDWRRLFAAHVAIASIGATLLLFFVLARYRLPAVPLLAIFAAFAVFHAAALGRQRRWRGLAAMAAVIAASAAIVNVPAAREDLTVAYYNLGNRYKATGQWELALDAYGEAIRRNPSYLSAHNNRALVYEATGNHREEAVAAWRHILEVGRSRGLARYVERAERHLGGLGADVPPDDPEGTP